MPNQEVKKIIGSRGPRSGGWRVFFAILAILNIPTILVPIGSFIWAALDPSITTAWWAGFLVPIPLPVGYLVSIINILSIRHYLIKVDPQSKRKNLGKVVMLCSILVWILPLAEIFNLPFWAVSIFLVILAYYIIRKI
jgi:hypothetical protein